MHPRHVFLAIVACSMSALACGKSGSRETRPVEVLYQVSGVSGTQFRILTPEEARPECPRGDLRARNAVHRFRDRIFTTPHLFILENAFQPTSATFELLAEETNPIQVFLFLGLDLARAPETIEPGDCLDVATAGVPVSLPNRNVRVEICGSIDDPPDGARCGDFPDAFVGFFLSAGDSEASYSSTCNLRQVAESCRTPATLFVEEPRDRIDVIVDTNSNENRDSILTVELYINDELVDSSTGRRNVAVSKDL
jgi:hypothetical protein